MAKLEYSAPKALTHPRTGAPGIRMNRVICVSFGEEGRAGKDIEYGEEHEL